jgi:SAM-dependent methyltransferase
MAVDKKLRNPFDEVAGLYDEVRPGYPEELVEDVIALSAIPGGGRILEIGCGPGKATLPFARRGYAMVCLEPGREMARLAAAHCRPFPAVQLQNTTFEDWPLQEGAFDLVMSATAFHWISPEVRLVKSAAALRKGGTLALFWNNHRDRDTALERQIEAVYRARAPQLLQARSQPEEELVKETVGEIEGSGLYGPVVVREYHWNVVYAAERYIQLINTYGSIRGLPEETRRHLLADIQAVLEQQGGAVESRYVSRLYVAKVKA